ncbi:6631_t:CDS:2, partial [Cetraspora pellucida]
DPDLGEVLDNEEPKSWFPSRDLKNLPTEIYSDCTLSRSERQKILHVLHPINNIEKVLFESKPSDGNQEALQEEFVLKALSSIYVLTKDRKGVFGDKFKDLVEEENTKSKLYNDANRKKRRFYLSNQTNQQSYTYATKRFISQITLNAKNGIDLEKQIRWAKLNLTRETSNWTNSMAVIHNTMPNTWSIKILQTELVTEVRKLIANIYCKKWLLTEWNQKPPLRFHSIKNNFINNVDIKLAKKEISVLLQTQAIQLFPKQLPCYISNVLMVNKKDRKKRVVLDLQSLYTFIRHTHFKMESIAIVKSLIRRNDYMASIDIKDAFFHIPLHLTAQNSTTHNKDAETIRNMHCNITGRLANNGEQERKLETTPQDCTKTFDQVRLHHKHTKEPIDTYSFLRILGIQNKLKEYNHHSSKKKNKPVKTGVQTSFNDA